MKKNIWYFFNFIVLRKWLLIKIWIQSSILVIIAIGIRGCSKTYFLLYCPRTSETGFCLVFALLKRFYPLELVIRYHFTGEFIQRIFLLRSNFRSIHIDFLKNWLVASLWMSLCCLRLFFFAEKSIKNYIIIVLRNKTT